MGFLGLVQELKCPYCGYEWTYEGTQLHYATCPKCWKKVRLHPYIRRGYVGRLKLKYPNDNYKFIEDVK